MHSVSSQQQQNEQPAPNGGGPIAAGVNNQPPPPSAAASKQLRKVSTQNCLETSSIPGLASSGGGGLGGKRHSTATEGGASITGGRGVPNFVFVPDYSVKAVSDVLYVKITRTTYMRAVKASLMTKKQSNLSEMIEKELDSFLDKVNEDDLEGETLIQTPILRSPDRSLTRDFQAVSNHDINSVRRESLARQLGLNKGKLMPSSGTSLPTAKRDLVNSTGGPTNSSRDEEEFWTADKAGGGGIGNKQSSLTQQDSNSKLISGGGNATAGSDHDENSEGGL